MPLLLELFRSRLSRQQPEIFCLGQQKQICYVIFIIGQIDSIRRRDGPRLNVDSMDTDRQRVLISKLHGKLEGLVRADVAREVEKEVHRVHALAPVVLSEELLQLLKTFLRKFYEKFTLSYSFLETKACLIFPSPSTRIRRLCFLANLTPKLLARSSKNFHA